MNTPCTDWIDWLSERLNQETERLSLQLHLERETFISQLESWWPCQWTPQENQQNESL